MNFELTLERHPLMSKDGVIERYIIPISSKGVEQKIIKDLVNADIRGDDEIEYGKHYTSMPIGKFWMKFTYDYVSKEFPDRLVFFLNFITKAELTIGKWHADLKIFQWNDWHIRKFKRIP